MLAIIDTCSLVAIARYYLSIKDEEKLLCFLETKFRKGELVLLETIYTESTRVQKGIATSRMEFLNDSKLQIKDGGLLPPAPQKFSREIDNNFCIPLQRKRLNDESYRSQKEEYLKSGDAKMVLYALNNADKQPVIITEETPQSNDNKLFRKIPVICDFLKIPYMSIAEWLSSNGVCLDWRCHCPHKT